MTTNKDTDITPTPRTDEQIWTTEFHHKLCDVVDMDFARQLERELTKKTNEVARLREELDRLKRGCQGSCYACEPVGEMNLKLEAEVARLREIVEQYRVWATSENPTQMELDDLKQKYDELN